MVGAPDPLYGEVVWAFLAPRPGARLDEAQVLDWCAARLADFKRPARIRVMPALPKGPTG